MSFYNSLFLFSSLFIFSEDRPLVAALLTTPHRPRTSIVPLEPMTPGRIAMRQKQIDYGKNTIGYETYIKSVPKTARRPRSDPQTPDIHTVCSRRSWDGQIKKWRRLLHVYDPLPVPLLESEAEESAALMKAILDWDSRENDEFEQQQDEDAFASQVNAILAEEADSNPFLIDEKLPWASMDPNPSSVKNKF
jgi:Histone RNA hairpin-binding protein RNA-binding domain